jgi:AcrR family transcriptional regulator
MGAVDATHERILDGAMRAISEHGLAGLAMRDVGTCAHVARGTVYRYFPTREALLQALTEREGRRFLEQWRGALVAAPAGPERMRLTFAYPARFIHDNPTLRKLIETDPEYVLRALRENFPAITATIAELFGPILADIPVFQRGAISADQVADWTARVLVSALLFPAQDPAAFSGSLEAIFRALRSQAA